MERFRGEVVEDCCVDVGADVEGDVVEGAADDAVYSAAATVLDDALAIAIE